MTVRFASRFVLLTGVLLTLESIPASLEQNPSRPPGNRRNFVSCPIVRDTRTVPCWLAQYEGELYYLGSQGSSASAFYPPQLGHEALIEGTLVDGPRVCGGRPLQPVRVSVMRELTPACNTIIPAEPGNEAPPSPVAPTPTFADTTRQFLVSYDFDSDYLTLHTTRIVLEAARVAKAIDARRVDVHGRRAATLLSNGKTLVEGATIGEVRAGKMAENLVGLGIPADRVHVTWQGEADAPDGVTDPENRRVTITLSDTLPGTLSGAAPGAQAKPHRRVSRGAPSRVSPIP